ncbi:hypothetical protein OPV22_002610 [Ensete ventricosum]|uniref:Alpha-D-phosphohexomutase alpha/beta/alpha domain-containing protein n=1 Tax=Ensete ventricosum TaxID=4639 RepID=A0AAV8RYE8_ENSVE|nr:hypothetical protein OPV22_002610 [Ensete ventricosum]
MVDTVPLYHEGDLLYSLTLSFGLCLPRHLVCHSAALPSVVCAATGGRPPPTRSHPMAVMSVMPIPNSFLAQHCQRNWQSNTKSSSVLFAIDIPSTRPFQVWKLAWTGMSAMQSHIISTRGISSGKPTSNMCNAAQGTNAVSSFEKVDFLKLQNGSDIRGVAVAGVEGEPVNLTEPVAEAIAAAFAEWLLEKKNPNESRRLRVSIGHDSRISAKKLQDAVSRGLAGAGLDVIQYGLASTPAMFNSTLTVDETLFCPVDGSIMITASHLPYNRNGFKFFTNDGGLGKPDIKDILVRVSNMCVKFSDASVKESIQSANATVKKVDYMAVYTSDLVAAVRKAAGNTEKPLEGFHIVVDAGNGAGGFFAGFVIVST